MPISTDVNQLLSDSACYKEFCMGDGSRLPIEIYARVQNLAAIGGTDYSNDLNGLLTATKTYQPLYEEQRKAIGVNIALVNAVADGAVIDTNVNSLKAESKCYECLGLETQKNLLLWLGIQINNFAKPD